LVLKFDHGGVAGLVLSISVALAPGPALARDLYLTEAGVPFVYRYASCVFKAPPRRLIDCGEVRATIESEAEEAFEDWHRGNILLRERQFARALEWIDAEATELAAAGGSVPATIISYMRCLGEGISTDPPFIDGSSIDYISIEKACADQVSAENGDSDEWRKHYLYRRLRREGRVINNAKQPLSTVTFQHGLLNIRRLMRQRSQAQAN
jgi:hypothetical protein